MGKNNSLFLWMEDFDNAELDRYAWEEQLEEAVLAYNREHGTDYNPSSSVRAYEQWVSQKNKPDM